MAAATVWMNLYDFISVTCFLLGDIAGEIAGRGSFAFLPFPFFSFFFFFSFFLFKFFLRLLLSFFFFFLALSTSWEKIACS